MGSNTMNKKKGLTLVEVIIVISILIVVTSGAMRLFRSFDEAEALNREFANTISLLEKARQETLFSKDSSKYGVRFNTDEMILFKGEFYATSSTDNIIVKLHPKVLISDINLPNGTTSVSFKRLSGETSQSGTITLQSLLDASNIKVITIEKTGIVR